MGFSNYVRYVRYCVVENSMDSFTSEYQEIIKQKYDGNICNFLKTEIAPKIEYNYETSNYDPVFFIRNYEEDTIFYCFECMEEESEDDTSKYDISEDNASKYDVSEEESEDDVSKGESKENEDKEDSKVKDQEDSKVKDKEDSKVKDKKDSKVKDKEDSEENSGEYYYIILNDKVYESYKGQPETFGLDENDVDLKYFSEKPSTYGEIKLYTSY